MLCRMLHVVVLAAAFCILIVANATGARAREGKHLPAACRPIKPRPRRDEYDLFGF